MFRNSQRPFEYEWAYDKLPKPPLKVLDVGCGRSSSEKGVEDFCRFMCERGYAVTGIDVRKVDWTHPNFTFINRSFLDSLLPKESFDYVVSFQTWQHMGLGYHDYIEINPKGSEIFISEMHRVLKNNGHAIITTCIKPSLERYDAKILTFQEVKHLLNEKFKILDQATRIDVPNTHLLLHLQKM